ncbi:hypothetical protein N665_0046s0072 [Sinapis alba]|nr:hypothetical protein N665_0046s0072 [Sinapis alba]
MVSDDAKALKKKEEAEEDNKSLCSFARKKKPTNANNAGSASRNLKKEVKDDGEEPIKSSLSGSRPNPVKKEIDENDDEKKPLSISSSSVGVSKERELKKKKKTGKEEEEEAEKKGKEDGEVKKKKREKKVYDLPGQKRDQPEERDPLRIFYETLHKQVPTSEMAKIWLMESGLLPAAEAKKVLEKKLQKTGKFSSPAKHAASTPRTSSKSVTEKKEVRKPSSEAVLGKNKRSDSKPTTKKRKKDSEDDEDSGDDFLANRVPKKTRAT